MARGRGVVIKIDSVMEAGEKLDQEPKGHERFFIHRNITHLGRRPHIQPLQSFFCQLGVIPLARSRTMAVKGDPQSPSGNVPFFSSSSLL